VLPAAAVARLASLRALRLADNRIHAVGPRSFAALTALRALRLDGNGDVEGPRPVVLGCRS